MLTILGLIAIVVVVTVSGYKLGTLVYKKDTKIEDAKRNLIKLARILAGMGLVKTPELLEDIVVSDVSGVVHKVKEVVELFLSSEDAVIAEFEKVFDNVLAAKLKSEAGRALIAAKLADAAKTTDVSVVQEAPVATLKS